MIVTSFGSSLMQENAVQLRVEGVYNDRGLDTGLRNVRSQSTLTEKQLKQLSTHTKIANAQSASLGKSIAKSALIFGGYGIAMAGATGLLKSSVNATKEQELAEIKRNQALKTAGVYTKEYVDALNAQASAFQRVSTTGDETTIKMQALLIAYGMNASQIKQTTQAALDFAAATDRDLQSSITLLAKAFKGETGELSRYGIVLDKSIPKTEKFAAVIKQLNEMFGGQAESTRESLSGSITAFGNSFGDFLETVAKPGIPVMKKLALAASEATDKINDALNGQNKSPEEAAKTKERDLWYQNVMSKNSELMALQTEREIAAAYQAYQKKLGKFEYEIDFNVEESKRQLTEIIGGFMIEEGNKFTANIISQQIPVVAQEMQDEFYKATTESLNSGLLEQIKQGAGISQLSLSLYDNIYTAVSDAVLKGLTEKVIQEQAINPIAQAIQKLSFVQIGGEYTGEVMGLDAVIDAARNASKQIELMSPIIQMVNSELGRFKKDLYETATAGQTAGKAGTEAFYEMAQAMKTSSELTEENNRKLKEGVAVLNEYAEAATRANSASATSVVGLSTSKVTSIKASRLSEYTFRV